MKVSVVYFEENTRRHERENIRATAAFKNLGARIAKFFSDSVTIIVSMRPYNKRGEYPQGFYGNNGRCKGEGGRSRS